MHASAWVWCYYAGDGRISDRLEFSIAEVDCDPLVVRADVSPLAGQFTSTHNDKGATMTAKMKDTLESDLEDIPMRYLWYVVLAIIAIVAGAVVLVIRLF